MASVLKQIKSLRDEGKTLKEIGEMLHTPISSERVRQILNPVEKEFCDKHKRQYTKTCRFCYVEKQYDKIIDDIIKNNLQLEVERLSIPNRSKEVVIQRIMLIRKLKDEYHMSLRQIGFLLKRDHTDISYLYKKNI